MTTTIGFMYRSCSEDDNGLIYGIVYWQNMQTPKAAALKITYQEKSN
ncbi:MAG: hypothetical protein ACI9IA_000481 [Enterobacterales bacterium]|jgi:hypothetical protein